MAFVTVTFLACWLAMTIAPATPIAAALRRWLVAAPARRLARIGRGDVVIAIVLVAAIVAMTCLEDGDPLRMAVMGLPDTALWLTTVELSAVVDLAIAVGVALAGWRGGGTRAFATTLGSRLRRRTAARARRIRRVRRPTAANDDDGPADRVLAA
ncbi:MAG: hypothetical protein PGN08_03235 [Sphingomonas taxi]